MKLTINGILVEVENITDAKELILSFQNSHKSEEIIETIKPIRRRKFKARNGFKVRKTHVPWTEEEAKILRTALKDKSSIHKKVMAIPNRSKRAIEAMTWKVKHGEMSKQFKEALKN